MSFYDYTWAAEVYAQFEKTYPRVAFVNSILKDKAAREYARVSFSVIVRGVIGSIQLGERTAHIWKAYKALVKGTEGPGSEIYGQKALQTLATALAKIGAGFLHPDLPLIRIHGDDRNTTDISAKALDDAVNSGIFEP